MRTLVLAMFVGFATQTPAQSSGTAESSSLSIQRLELGAGLPDQLAVEIDLGGEANTLVLYRRSYRSPDFRLLVEVDAGELVEQPAPEPRTYSGTVFERPDWQVAGSRMPAGLRALVARPGEPSWVVEPAPEFGAGMHLVYEHEATPVDCGTDEGYGANYQTLPGGNSGGAGGTAGADNCTRLCEIAIDTDYEMYQWHNFDTAAVLADIDSVLAAVEMIHARDVLVSYTVTTVIVRTDPNDPYFGNDMFTVLDEFRVHWTNNMGGIQRDTAHICCGRFTGSGVAWVGVICSQTYGYGLSGFTGGFGNRVTVMGHELGHNWSAPHCLDPSCVLMCGGCHEFGPITAAQILNYKDAVACLDDGVDVLPPIGPRAQPDMLDANGVTLLDVLANDHDANCDPVLVDSFDSVTAQGGEIELSIGSGPGGRDELRYIPPESAFLGADFFNYTAGDGNGGTWSAPVAVLDPRVDLVGHYQLNEKPVRTKCVDASDANRHGTFAGGVTKHEPGARPETVYSVWFDGVDGRVEIPDEAIGHHLTKNFTVAAWIKPEGLFGQRILCNPSSWAFGLTSTGLRFSTFGVAEYLTDTPIPKNSWTHVAAVFKPNYKVTFFVNGVEVDTRPGDRPANTPGPTWYIGTRGDGTQFFRGHIDDVQIYDAALIPSRVQWLYDNPGEVLCTVGWFNYGEGHPGKKGVPELTVAGLPRVGTKFTLNIGNSTSGSPALSTLFLGFSKVNLPLWGGSLLVNPHIILPLVVPPTGLNLTFQIPSGVPCVPVYFQVMEADSAAFGGFSFTRGLEVDIGF